MEDQQQSESGGDPNPKNSNQGPGDGDRGMPGDTEYKLVYFNCRGICEPIRYIFAIAGQPYQDIRIPLNWNSQCGPELPSEWAERIQYGKIPFLQIGPESDNRTLVSSKPICRYLASQFGLTADDPFDDAKCDEYMDSFRDFLDLWRPIYFCPEEEKKRELIAGVMTKSAQTYLGTYNDIIAANNGQNLVGSKLTWADVYLGHGLDHLQAAFKIEILSPYPALTQLYDHIHSLPQLQHWLQTRPKTDF